mmetsp:Transcript_37305/g.98704  ORF Transcript_37305/g.98704 Transcript_37305/m.98704 type:complete len:80 (-) Transcript_37305:855-1094(-)
MLINACDLGLWSRFGKLTNVLILDGFQDTSSVELDPNAEAGLVNSEDGSGFTSPGSIDDKNRPTHSRNDALDILLIEPQ